MFYCYVFRLNRQSICIRKAVHDLQRHICSSDELYVSNAFTVKLLNKAKYFSL